MKATEVTAGLAESNGSLLPGLWRDSLHVTCGLTACTPGSASGPTLGMGKLYLFTRGRGTVATVLLCNPSSFSLSAKHQISNKTTQTGHPGTKACTFSCPRIHALCTFGSVNDVISSHSGTMAACRVSKEDKEIGSCPSVRVFHSIF